MFKNAACASFARASVVAALGGAAILFLSSGALAAEAAAEEATEEEADEGDDLDDDLELSDVVVTGSRINLPNVTSANPVTTVTAEEMARLGIVNVADAITTLVPQNISTYQPMLTGDDQVGTGGAGMESLDRGSFFIGNTIANLRGLDPTFGTRTLTLIDGRRVNSTSNQADVVDLNIIPSNLLERMDVVTGGASTTYGSGAMAGVVNLVLNRRLTGVNLDLTYGINEAGDGDSPQVSLSGGTPVLGGKGHVLLGLEWQDNSAIRNCAAARDWCAESRFELTNYTTQGATTLDPFTPIQGFGDGSIDWNGDGILNELDQNGINDEFPARFEMANVRRSQFAPTGTIRLNNSTFTTDWKFNEAGTELEEYALGFRGGTGQNAMNGDGPLATWGQVMRSPTDRKSIFANFEYDISSRTTAYVQARYARTDSSNINNYSTGEYCVRFDTAGVARVLGGSLEPGTEVFFGQGASGATWFEDGVHPTTGEPHVAGQTLPAPARSSFWLATGGNQNFRDFLGYQINGGATNLAGYATMTTPPPYYIPNDTAGANTNTSSFWMPGEVAFGPGAVPPSLITFANATPNYVHIRIGTTEYWLMYSVTLNAGAAFFDPGTPAVLPTIGPDSYAFLHNLTPDAQNQLRNSFSAGTNFGNIVDQTTGALAAGASQTAAGGSGSSLNVLYGNTPCNGFTAIRKVWNTELFDANLNRWTEQRQEPWSTNAGIRGRFGGDWRWEGYVQYGKTDSNSVQHNVGTNLRMAMANEAVIDDNPASPTYGTPVCRVVRDGVPIIDYLGRPVSEPEALQALAADCKPLNIFGLMSAYSTNASFDGYYDEFGNPITYDAVALQQAALDYAFVETYSSGWNDQAIVSFNTSGTLWDGFGAGPLTGAFGAEVSQNRTTNLGTTGTASFYERADLSSSWADAFGGKTRATEGYTELNLPIVSGVEGVNLFSLNVGARYTSYYNKGGAGTTRGSGTQDVFNWKFQTVYEPFEWVRLRMTRSRDQRAAGFRDLFVQQPGLPDQFDGSNNWRPYNPDSTEGRYERWGQTRVGNSRLNPEKSDTMTLGMVLSPGGWAQGMRFSLDYFDIRIKDSISTPFSASTTSTINACWEGSGNADPTTDEFGNEVDAINGLLDLGYYDPDLQSFPCQEIQFAGVFDGDGNPVEQFDASGRPIGNRDLQDIVNYNSARPVNSPLPTQRRGMDLSINYNFPLNRLFESLPGSVSFNLRATRALEASGYQTSTSGGQAGSTSLGLSAAQCAAAGGSFSASPFGAAFNSCTTGGSLANAGVPQCQAAGGQFINDTCYFRVNLVGQIRSSVFVPGVAASPKWTGNFSASYLMGDLSTTLGVRYTGGAVLNNLWCDAAQAAQGCPYYSRAVYDEQGNFIGNEFLGGSTDTNRVKPYALVTLSAQYNLKVGNMRQFQLTGTINNLMDKSPVYTGGGVGGSTGDTMGRAYRFGVRMRF